MKVERKDTAGNTNYVFTNGKALKILVITMMSHSAYSLAPTRRHVLFNTRPPQAFEYVMVQSKLALVESIMFQLYSMSPVKVSITQNL